MTTHILPSDPTVRQRPAAGPTFDPTEWPDPGEGRPTVPTEVDEHLTRIEVARQRQLDALPATNLDAVAAAHRGTVERILEEVGAARHRLIAGLYGTCARCAGEIPSERLELRPWATTCAACAVRHHR
jgi:DnaK suppressor protein